MKQFEIWWATLPAPAGRRPVLLLSRNDAYAYLNKFIAAEITTMIRSIPVEVRLGRREGLPSPCVANLDNLRTIPRSVLDSCAGAMANSRHAEVKRALGYALDWEELSDIGA
ncbi:MAG: type II toxin-antitoxin system PemK/MazF family toxin [Acidobacteriota bacterium]